MQVQRFVPGEVLVKTKPNIFQSQNDLVKDYGAKVLDSFESDNIFQSRQGEVLHLALPEGADTEQVLEKLAKDPRVELAAANTVFTLQGAAEQENLPNDLVPDLWGMHNEGQNGGTPDADIDAPEAWKITRGKREGGPIIAVLDTGQDYNHPDLVANTWVNPGEVPGDGIDNDGNGVIDDVHGYNAVLDNGDPMAGHPHGTHCAGTIGAVGNNGEGVVGVNWEAQIMPIKIFPDDGEATTAATILRAIEYADKMGARITSNSWGGAGYNPIVKEAFANSPALHIFAAGNDARNNDLVADYPSNFDIDNMVVVAASDRNDQLGNFSSFGEETVDLAAPGVAILSAVNGGGYASWNGTSMATPHVAGVAGLVAAEYPDASNQQIKDRLLFGSDYKENLRGKVKTAGRLNAANSVSRDSLPPGTPKDFRARALPDKMRTAWTSSGDDGWCGNASAYEVRMSPNPIGSQEAFQAAEQVVFSRANEPGTIEAPMFDVMPSGEAQTLHVGMQMIDKVGNRSELVTQEVSVPAARVAFEDKFEGDESWTASKGWSRVDGERGPAWKIEATELGAESALVSRPFRLEDSGDSTLFIEANYDLETHYEFVKVEVSEVGSHRWRRLGELNGNSRGYKVHKLPMNEFDQKEVQIRFRFEGDGPGPSGGFELNRMAVTGYRIGTQNP